MHVKDRSCNSLQDFRPLLKRDFPVNIPKVLGTVFFIEQFQWLFFNNVLVSERILKKEVSGEIGCDLISLFHMQIQEPTSSSTTTTAFVFLAKFAEFYYHKIFEERS